MSTHIFNGLEAKKPFFSGKETLPGTRLWYEEGPLYCFCFAFLLSLKSGMSSLKYLLKIMM
jgi:hypothetical protein